jgi:hypothetical protein
MLVRILPFFLAIGCSNSGRQLAVVGEWLERPHTIEICPDNRVSEERILEQANWWHETVHPDYTYFEQDQMIHSDCDELVESGVVRIRRATFGEVLDHSASAWASYSWEHDVIVEEDEHSSTTRYNNLEYLDACTVSIGKLNTKWVIRHEFGHCWGWDHTLNDEWTHLMSPKVGHDIEGLEHVPSESWIE